MARDGSGNYVLSGGNPVVPNTVISSGGWANPTLSDIAAALTQSLSKDGQTTPTANLPMGNFRHFNVANAASRTDYAAAGQVQDSVMQWLTAVSGTDTITANLATPALAAYAAGQTFRFVAAGANATNAPTLNINSIGAKNLTKYGAGVLSKGDIPAAGAIVEVVYDGTQFQVTGIIPFRGGYSVRGLVGANNGATPNTKMDFSADAVTLMNPVTGESITRINTGTITCDVGLAGPAANGRDQAGAFSASTWLHFYFIWNGSTLATLVSAVAPPTGPTLPTGYTHWAYAGAVYFNGSSQMPKVYARGNKFSYAGGVSVLNSGSATSPAAISLSAAIPPNASTASLYGYISYFDSSVANVPNVNLYIDGSTIFLQTGITEPVANAAMRTFMGCDVPNVSQTIYYAWDAVVGTRGTSIAILGYTIPNGA